MTSHRTLNREWFASRSTMESILYASSVRNRAQPRKWKQIFARRNALVRFSTRMGRDPLHNKASMYLRFAACNTPVIQVLTMLPEAAEPTSETRKSPKTLLFVTRKSSDKAPNSPNRTFSGRNRPREINNFALNFFPTGNSGF